MNTEEREAHWNDVYQKKAAESVSWYQPLPLDSLDIIQAVCKDKDAPIIDIGCGDAYLTEVLLKKGFTCLSALDVSRMAIDRARERIGEPAKEVKWLIGDVLRFHTEQPYFFWHDRAAFHFLTAPDEIATYAAIAGKCISTGGYLLVAAFSECGPEKCSDLPVHRYHEESIALVFRHDFELVQTLRKQHLTPGNKEQEFIFAVFQKI